MMTGTIKKENVLESGQKCHKHSQTNWFLTHLLPTFALPAIEKMHLRANHATQQDLRGILLGAQRSKAKSTVKVCVCVCKS